MREGDKPDFGEAQNYLFKIEAVLYLSFLRVSSNTQMQRLVKPSWLPAVVTCGRTLTNMTPWLTVHSVIWFNSCADELCIRPPKVWHSQSVHDWLRCPDKPKSNNQCVSSSASAWLVTSWTVRTSTSFHLYRGNGEVHAFAWPMSLYFYWSTHVDRHSGHAIATIMAMARVSIPILHALSVVKS